MNAKKSKLTEQFNKGASKESHLQATSKIFSGISVYVNGYTGKLRLNPIIYRHSMAINL
jgi:hypothetical protein